MAATRLGIVCLVLVGCASCAGVAAAPPCPAVPAPNGAPAPSAPAAALPAPAADPLPDDLDALADETEDETEACDDEELEDGLELPPDIAASAPEPVSPLAAMTNAQIEEKLRTDPASLGPMSLGSTNAGRLFNAVQMPESDLWTLIDRARAWGTQETIDALARAIGQVHKRFPDSPKVAIGHISARRGGHLSPHISHQAGRDVDVGYYLHGRQSRGGFIRARKSNLDRERTWALVRALVTETDVELILIDSGVQRLLKKYALKIGEDAAWIDEIFQYRSRSPRPLIRHAKGHANHLHVRFYSPIARASAIRAYSMLVKLRKIPPTIRYIRHKVKSGQTLGILARRYHTTVEAIQKANGLHSTLIKARHILNIPHRGAQRLVMPSAPPAVPPRRLPPAAPAASPAPAAASSHGSAVDG